MGCPDIYQPERPRRISRHTIRDVEYAVSEWGTAGRPMFIWLHGWGDCAATFQFVVDALVGEWHVIAPDFRGFGDSASDALTFWFPDYLADLDCLLDVYSPAQPVLLAGHSMGANIGGLFAGALPGRVAAFVNVEGFGLPDSDPAEAPARYREWIERGRGEPAFSSYDDYAALAARVLKRNPRAGRERADFVARHWAREQDGRIVLRASPRHRLPNAVLYRRAESEACWRAVRAPVLIVAGGDSEFAAAADPRLGTGSLSLPFREAETRVIPDAGHMVHFEQPAALAREIEAFLGACL